MAVGGDLRSGGGGEPGGMGGWRSGGGRVAAQGVVGRAVIVEACGQVLVAGCHQQWCRCGWRLVRGGLQVLGCCTSRALGGAIGGHRVLRGHVPRATPRVVFTCCKAMDGERAILAGTRRHPARVESKAPSSYGAGRRLASSLVLVHRAAWCGASPPTLQRQHTPYGGALPRPDCMATVRWGSGRTSANSQAYMFRRASVRNAFPLPTWLHPNTPSRRLARTWTCYRLGACKQR